MPARHPQRCDDAPFEKVPQLDRGLVDADRQKSNPRKPLGEPRSIIKKRPILGKADNRSGIPAEAGMVSIARA